MFDELLAFLAKHGHADVPWKYEPRPGVKLSQWLRNQRSQESKIAAEQGRQALLASVGVYFGDRQERSFFDNAYAAREYMRLNEKHRSESQAHSIAEQQRDRCWSMVYQQ
jgi:hypothetical protein